VTAPLLSFHFVEKQGQGRFYFLSIEPHERLPLGLRGYAPRPAEYKRALVAMLSRKSERPANCCGPFWMEQVTFVALRWICLGTTDWSRFRRLL
jgi:hypothetical protein